jgi:flavin reductase (DIM6/NTAB) family NADH-FMN oxidoreductase RutF
MNGAEKIKEALKKVVNGVFVITTKCGDKVNGMTAVWLTTVSFDPPLVCVSIGKEHFTHNLTEKSGVFAVNILKEGQVDIGKHFGFTSGRETDKFANIPYTTKTTGSPILKDVAAYLDCKVTSSVDIGNLTLFIGKVLDAWTDENAQPLVFREKDFFE